MSDTPETDAFFDHAISTKNKYPAYCALFEGFCQKLERERNETRFLLKAAKSTLNAIHLEVGGWIKIMKENTD
jgi:hypothetical protein